MNTKCFFFSCASGKQEFQLLLLYQPIIYIVISSLEINEVNAFLRWTWSCSISIGHFVTKNSRFQTHLEINPFSLSNNYH